jgi:hypothetical protein
MGKHQLARKPNGDVKTHYFPFDGALNLVDAPLDTKEGMVLGAVNYEQRVRGGYRRIEGHERFDGQDSPSDENYWLLNFDAGDIVEPEIGGYAHGITSDAKGKVGIITLESGSWVGSDAVGFLVLFDVTGTFLNNETINFTGAGDGFNSGYSNGFG